MLNWYAVLHNVIQMLYILNLTWKVSNIVKPKIIVKVKIIQSQKKLKSNYYSTAELLFSTKLDFF
jgi:hypothetical protein